jgi:hypothetical protein
MTPACVQDAPAVAGIGERPQRRVVETIAAALVGTAILLAALLAGTRTPPSSLVHPTWLVPAGLWLLVPHRSASLRRMQDLVFAYISLVMVTEAARLSWEVGSFRVSASVVCVALAGAGWMVPVLRRDPRGVQRPVLPDGTLVVAAGVLAVHALTLGVVLHGWYGYGYEADIAVAGRVALCIVWLGLAEPLVKASGMRAAVAVGSCLLWAWSRA